MPLGTWGEHTEKNMVGNTKIQKNQTPRRVRILCQGAYPDHRSTLIAAAHLLEDIESLVGFAMGRVVHPLWKLETACLPQTGGNWCPVLKKKTWALNL
jgi:hypothetical protein